MLRYRVKDKRCWSMSVRDEFAYVWQHARFEGDIGFWRKKLSHPQEVGPVKDGACLRFYLYSDGDFDCFHKAVTEELQSVNWLNGLPENGTDLQNAEVDGQA